MSVESQQIETTTTTAAIPPPQKKVKLDEDNLPRDDDSSIHTANGTAKSLLNGIVDAPNGNEKQPDPVNNGPPLTSTDAPPSNGSLGNDKQLGPVKTGAPPSNGSLGNDKQLGPVNNDPPANSPPPPKNNLKRPFSSVEADGENENETVAPENVVEPNEEGDERDEEEGEDDEDDDDVDEEDEDDEEVENDLQKEEVIVNTAAAGDEDESGWD